VGAGLAGPVHPPQEELAERMHTTKTTISRIENHAEDIKLSTLEEFAHALGKKLKLKVAQSL